ncbi:MAG: B3/4 domain-containing protein [Candidatus Bathyarchaeia archaeon]
MKLTIDPSLKIRFPTLKVLTPKVTGVRVKKRSPELKRFGGEVAREIKRRYDLGSLKDLPNFRAYRDFFWRVGIDPTKSRPAAEALIRRVLRGRPIPNINTLVDAYNLASMQTEVALAAFDADRLKGDLTMRFAVEGEEFLGIGMEKPISLEGGEVVVSDEEKLVAIYPHRDAEEAKITKVTRNVLLLVCGVPGLSDKVLQKAGRVAVEYITRFCGGGEITSLRS